ncbi:hypothetical protein D3C80_711850 [compost metagenome]
MLAAGLHFTGHGLGTVEVVADLAAALFGQFVGGAGRLRGGHRIARHFFHGGGHFGDGGGGLFQLLVLLAQAVGTLFGNAVERPGGLGQLRRAAGDLPQGVALAVLHALQFAEQLADLVAAVHRYRHAQVAAGDALEVLTGVTQRAQHALGDKAPAKGGQQQGQQPQRHAQQLGTAQAPVRFEHDLLAALVQRRHQFLPQRLQAAHGVACVGVDPEVVLQVVVPGGFTLPGHGLGVVGEGALQLHGEGFECRLLGIADQRID